MRLGALGIFGVAALALLGGACGKNNGASEVPDRKVCQVNLAIAGMVCEDGCPIRVRAALAQVNGVQDVSVDYASNNVVVDAVFPACSRDGAEQMVDALWQKGYTAKVTGSRAVVAWQ
ncbi:MAG: heavy metal-associated domain-containing protein [Polyangiaceae bacterium]